MDERRRKRERLAKQEPINEVARITELMRSGLNPRRVWLAAILDDPYAKQIEGWEQYFSELFKGPFYYTTLIEDMSTVLTNEELVEIYSRAYNRLGNIYSKFGDVNQSRFYMNQAVRDINHSNIVRSFLSWIWAAEEYNLDLGVEERKQQEQDFIQILVLRG